MTTLVWFWLLILPSWENKSPPWSPSAYLFVPLICVIPGVSLLIGSLVLHGAQVHIQPCHHLARLCGRRRRRRSCQQWPLPEQLCWALLTEDQSIPAMCTSHRSLGQVRERVQEPENKGISHMDSHCPQLKPSITPIPACSWMVQLPSSLGIFSFSLCPRNTW